jgi:hypothetical protein
MMSQRVLMAIVVACFVQALAAAQARAGIERVAWLQGCWEMTSGQTIIEEHWMAPRGGTMIGAGRTVRDNALVEYEQVILREQNGQLAYEAHPSGQSPAVFLSKDITGSMVIFENSMHDFPQRVGYRRDGRDALLAWVEGTVNGQSRRIEFPYRRIECQ